MTGAVPGFLSKEDAIQPGHVLVEFARYLHIDLGLLASTVREYVVHVIVAHTARGMPSPGRHPDWTLVDKRLEKLAADAPCQALCIGAGMVRVMMAGTPSVEYVDLTIAYFFLGARPIELLGSDEYKMARDLPVLHPLFDQRRMRWDHVTWHRADGTIVHGASLAVTYVLVGLKRKSDPYNVQRLPVFCSGASKLCFVRMLQARGARAQWPQRGPVFGVHPSGAFFRQSAYRAWLHKQQFRCGVGRLVPYGFRRGLATSLDHMPLALSLQLQFLAHKPAVSTSKTHVRYVDPDPAGFQEVAAGMLTVRLVTMRS